MATTNLEFTKRTIESELGINPNYPDGIDSVALEFLFAADIDRKWCFDLALIKAKIALEVDGGVFSGGAHVRGARIRKTHEKLNCAACRGWRVVYCLPEDVISGKAATLVLDCWHGRDRKTLRSLAKGRGIDKTVTP